MLQHVPQHIHSDSPVDQRPWSCQGRDNEHDMAPETGIVTGRSAEAHSEHRHRAAVDALDWKRGPINGLAGAEDIQEW